MWVLPLSALLLWLTLLSVRAFGAGLSPLVSMLASLMVSLDLADLMVRVWVTRRERFGSAPSSTSIPLDVGVFTPHQIRLHTRPFAFMVAVRNASEDLDDFLESLEPFRDRLYVIDDASTDGTYARLRQAGIHAMRLEKNLKKPGALRELLASLPKEIETVVVLDPDVEILDQGGRLRDIERVIFDFQRSGCAAVCPNVVVRPGGWLARLQSLEYRMAIGLGRRSLADHGITSGVSIYRRDALEAALGGHSLSVYAEDLRNALILLGRGERIYYDGRFLIETEAKRTWAGWFSQRVGWHYGLLRVYTEHFSDVWRASRGRPFFAYQFLVYLGFFGLVLQPLRLLSVAIITACALNGAEGAFGLDLLPDNSFTAPALFLLAYLKFTAVTMAASAFATSSLREWALFQPVVPLYFFYAIAYVVPATFGYLNWFTLRLFGRRTYRDHFDDAEASGQSPSSGKDPGP